jgi:dephospho-CoA kinase
VKKWVKQDIIEKKKMGVPLYVIEAALLPEAGYENICDELWYIYTEEAVRRERLKKSRGYSDEAISRMILSQSPESVFREVCRVVIDNSGTFEETKEQIGEQL